MENTADFGLLLQLKSFLRTKGVRPALAFLNSLTAHRFTSLFRFDGSTLKNVTFYDRQNPEIERCENVPLEATYCGYLRDGMASLVFSDTRLEERLNGHPQREIVQRYCGVPLYDHAGKICGSICHFDLEPGQIEDRDIDLLERMAELLKSQF